MTPGVKLHRMLIADTTPMIAQGLKLLLNDGSLPVLVGISSCRIELMDRLQHSKTDLLILDPAFVQRDLDLGNMDSIASLSHRFPRLSILLHTTVTDPQLLEKMSKLDRFSIASKADELQDVVQIVRRLLKGETDIMSPKTERMICQARSLRRLLPELYAF
ncbi:Response regulator receiver [Burkholderia sp. 8Y]|nr:Response regulator receiver [Burkholderia sp. 8Y]